LEQLRAINTTVSDINTTILGIPLCDINNYNYTALYDFSDNLFSYMMVDLWYNTVKPIK
jgi:hypothetical protein